jgi:hypothetical protein
MVPCPRAHHQTSLVFGSHPRSTTAAVYLGKLYNLPSAAYSQIDLQHLTKMKPETYEAVLSIEEPELISRSGGPGKALFQFKENLRWYILIISLYTLGSAALTVWVVLGPILKNGKRVLRTGNVKVDQFYSGLALSVLVTPAAITIRRIAHDLALIHPFAVASKAPTLIADLDVMMDPGFFAVTRLMKYSFPAATIQSLLLLSGAIIMPVGTLLVTTDTYAAPNAGTGSLWYANSLAEHDGNEYRNVYNQPFVQRSSGPQRWRCFRCIGS